MKKKDSTNAGNARAVPSAHSLDFQTVSQDLVAIPIPPDDPRQRHVQRFRTISSLTAADPDRLRALAGAFVKANQIDLQQLRHLHCKGDRLGLRQLAHRIKGAAQMTGDAQLVALCTELGLICDNPQVSTDALHACIQKMDQGMCEFGESCQRMMLDSPPAF